MAYKNSQADMRPRSFSKEQGDMRPNVENMAKPEGCYSQMYDQAPLNYIERQNSIQKNEAGQLRSEAYRGRYDK